MITLLLFLVALAGLLVVMRREAGAKPAIGVMVVVGLLSCVLASGWLALLLFAGAAVTAAAGLPGFRRSWLTPKIFAVFKQVAPKVSDTEKVALEAGTVGWDGELFTGRPDWHSLLVNRHPGHCPMQRLGSGGGTGGPARGAVGVPQEGKILRHDHSERIRRARLLCQSPDRRAAEARRQRDADGDRRCAQLPGARRAAG
jgi:hypothetical protein